MILDIRTSIGLLKHLKVNTENDRKREVYLDGKRVPKGLEEIILAGVDALERRSVGYQDNTVD